MNQLRIATRGSALARWQAEHVAGLLAPTPVELVIVRTEGDRAANASLQEIGGLGVFTKEVQWAVLRHEADLAVHSLKDLPTEPTEGLVLAAVPQRGPVVDVFVSQQHAKFDNLPHGARIATGSARRRAMIRHRRQDLQLVDIRGNIDTRLRLLTNEQLDGLILAEAGLLRLGLTHYITERLDTTWMIPAVGQGALGIECRADDKPTYELLQPLNHVPSWATITAERAFLRTLGGGCQVPIGAFTQVIDSELTITGCVLSNNGSNRRIMTNSGPITLADSIGQSLAQNLTDP